MRTTILPAFLYLMCVAITARCSLGREQPRGNEPANAATNHVHDEARRILSHVKTTEYRHKTSIDESQGAYYCDCSGFVGYVLDRTVSQDGRKGPLANGKRRPLAMDYEKFFAAAPSKSAGDSRWQQIVRLEDARPGDVIAWSHEKPKPGNTGHVVIVDQAPVADEDGLVRVVVIDSTTLPSADITGDKGKTGIGRRTMWFKVDSEGRAVAYIRGKRTAKPKTEPISIGRALPTSAAAAEKRPAGRRAA
jgi:hypothetical protein